MTEKRFNHKYNMLGMQFICYDDKDILLGTFADSDGVEHIVDKLNQLNDENEQLKSRINDYDIALKTLQDLTDRRLKENEQLKSKNRGLQSELGIFKEDVTHSNLQINKLTDENEQLKSELKALRKKYNDFSDAVDRRLQEMGKRLLE